MLRAFSTSATGMQAQQMIVDVIANNLANINTTGFKKSQVDFQDLIYVKSEQAGNQSASGIVAPSGTEIGSGVRPASTLKVFSQGEMQNTGRTLDLAIEGDGFFQVVNAAGEVRYTRDGSFRVNSEGSVCNADGFLLDPAIQIPAEASEVGIGQDGTVVAFVPGQAAPQAVGQITLARFANPSGLTAEGRNILAETDASGTPTTGTPGTEGLGTLQQGFLEKSNVQMVTELVNLITAQRAYETNSRSIKAGDEMLTTTNRLLG
ncbi:MAG: flagellar basal-body rod protein FlgG [Phycisphaerae bacterium]